MNLTKQELKAKIKTNYAKLNRMFGVMNKPDNRMRLLQQETWELKKQLELLKENNA